MREVLAVAVAAWQAKELNRTVLGYKVSRQVMVKSVKLQQAAGELGCYNAQRNGNGTAREWAH